MNGRILHKRNVLNLAYLASAAAYSSVRKILQVNNATVEEYNFEKKERVKHDMLTTDKVIIVGYAIIVSPFMFPFWLYRDARSYEIKKRQIDVAEYTPTSVADYMFH